MKSIKGSFMGSLKESVVYGSPMVAMLSFSLAGVAQTTHSSINHMQHVEWNKSGVNSFKSMKDYYDEADSALIGQAEDGSYYYYVPDTGEVADFG